MTQYENPQHSFFSGGVRMGKSGLPPPSTVCKYLEGGVGNTKKIYEDPFPFL
jgi:hypothetical protein